LMDDVDSLADRMDRGWVAWLRLSDAQRLSKLSGGREIVLRLLHSIAEPIDLGSLPGPEKARLLVEGASSALAIGDVGLAEQLNSTAIDAASGINDDATSYLKVAASMLIRVSGDLEENEARDLAAMLVRATDSAARHVTDPEKWMPYQTVLQAAAALDLGTGFNTAIRWSDRGTAEIVDSVFSLARGGSISEELSPMEAFCLTGFSDVSHYNLQAPLSQIARALELGQSVAAAAMLGMIAQRVLRDTAVDVRGTTAKHLVDWCASKGLDRHEAAQSAGEFVEFIESLASSDAEGSDVSVTAGDDFTEVERPTNADELADLLLRTATHLRYQEVVRSIASEFGDTVARPRRLGQLKALIARGNALEPGALAARSFSICIDELFRSWAPRTSDLRAWDQAEVVLFVERHFTSLFEFANAPGGSWALDLNTPIRSSRTTEALGRTIERNLEGLSAAQLVYSLPRLSEQLSPSEVADLARYVLDVLANPEERSAATDSLGSSTLEDFLWTLLGDPDTAIRWRAAHVTRSLIEHSSRDLVANLAPRLLSEDRSDLSGRDLRFLSMSAGSWLLIVLAHASGRWPSAITPVAGVLESIALSSDFPHSVWRELARRALSSLSDLGQQVLDEQSREELELANRPRSCLVTRRRDHGDGVDRVSRFRFDELDTIPYWFDPLADLFGRPVSEPLQRAESWMVDRWLETDARDEDLRLASRGIEWGETQNRHGSLPGVETPQLYAEYHGLLVAAGEMVDECPVLVPDYSEDIDPWIYWIRHHVVGDSRQTEWPADRRRPVPLVTSLHSPPESAIDESHLSPAVLREYTIPERDEHICIRGSAYVYSRNGTLVLDTIAALVDWEHYDSVVQAVLGSDARWLQLPQLMDGADPEDDDVWAVGASVKPLAGVEYGFREGPEMHDPLMGSGLPLQPILFPALERSVAARPRSRSRPLIDTSVLVELQCWEDLVRPHDDNQRHSTGYRVVADRSLLVRAQDEAQNVILIETVGHWRRSTGRFAHAAEEYPEEASARVLFVVNATGRVDAVGLE